MKIVNRYHKRLSFVIDGRTFGIDSGEIVDVDDLLGRELIKSAWITEVKEHKIKPSNNFEYSGKEEQKRSIKNKTK